MVLNAAALDTRIKASIDFHHQSPMMKKIAELRDTYNLHMKVERYKSEDTIPATDQKYIRN